MARRLFSLLILLLFVIGLAGCDESDSQKWDEILTGAQVVLAGFITWLATAMKSATGKAVEEQATRDKGQVAILDETTRELSRSREVLGDAADAIRASIAAQTLAAERDARAAEAAYALATTVDRLATEVTRSNGGIVTLTGEIHDATTESRATRRSYDGLADATGKMVQKMQAHMVTEEQTFAEIMKRLP